MKFISHNTLLIILIAAAFICYSFAITQDAALFFILGVLLELSFWIKLVAFKLKPKRSKP